MKISKIEIEFCEQFIIIKNDSDLDLELEHTSGRVFLIQNNHFILIDKMPNEDLDLRYFSLGFGE